MLFSTAPLDAQTPWAVVEQWTDVMQQWLGDDWQSQAITWLITKPLALPVLVLVPRRVVSGERREERGPASRAPPPVVAGRRVQRAETMGSLLKSVTSIVIFTI